MSIYKRYRKIIIISPTESILTKRGNRHPQLALYLKQQGYEVEYITSNFYHAEKIKFTNSEIERAKHAINYKLTIIPVLGYNRNISIRRVLSNILFSSYLLLYLLAKAKRNNILIVPSRPVEVLLVAAITKVLKGTSVIVDIRDIWPDALTIGNIFVISIFRIYCNIFLYPSIRILDKYVHTSPSYLDWLQRYKKNAKSVFIPLGYDAERWKIDLNEKNMNKGARFRLVYVGALQYQIDIIPVLQAIKDFDNFELIIIGEDGKGQRFAEVLNYIRKNNVRNVIFYGYVEPPMMNSFLKNADIGIVPMISNSIPNKVFDYIASYLPIMVLGNTDCAKFVTDLGIGWQVGFNAEDVHYFLSHINRDDIIRAQQNIRSVRSSFSRDVLFKKFLDVIAQNP